MKNKLIYFTIICITSAFFLIKIIILPPKIISFLSTKSRTLCSSCQLSIEHSNITVFPPGLILTNSILIIGVKGDSQVVATLPKIDLSIKLSSLWSNNIHVKFLKIVAPKVVLNEGNIFTKATPRTNSLELIQLFQIDEIEIKDGTFNYYREHQDRHPDIVSTFSANNIDVSIDQIGNTTNRRTQATHAHVTGVFQQSGKVDLNIESTLFSKELSIDLRTIVLNQKLEELNSYFDVNDGIKLKGTAEIVQTSVTLRGRTLNSTATATYKGLGVKFRKMKGRSRTEVFFSNLISSFKIHKDNKDQSNSKYQSKAKLNQKINESLVTFILRGMITASLKVATH